MDGKGPTSKLVRMAIVCWVLVALWMVAIFTFSSNPADESEEQSGYFTRIIASMVVPGYAGMTPEQQEAAAQPFDHPVRKTAHALEYALLGVLTCSALLLTWRSGQGSSRENPTSDTGGSTGPALLVGLSTAIGALYAGTDEIHQLFVPGRAGMISDVALDTAGVLAGALVALIVLRAVGRRTRLQPESVTREAAASEMCENVDKR